MATLGTKIRKLRELRNFKQDYMATVLGISQSTYCKIESDEVSVSHERLEQIAKALDLSIQDILAFDEKKVYNVMNNHNATGEVHIQHYHEFSEQVKSLYDDKIRLMEEIIQNLKKENERLNEEIKKLGKGQ